MLATVVAATVVLGLGLPLLGFSSAQDTLVPSGSRTYRDNVRFQRRFGGEPVLVLFTGDVRKLFEPDNAAKLAALDAKLDATHLYHSVLSPLTTVQFAATQVQLATRLAPAANAREQDAAANAAAASVAAAHGSVAAQQRAAAAARSRVAAGFAERTSADALRIAAAGEQSLRNPRFVDFLLFDERGRVRSSFTSQFPDPQHALMVVRLRGNQSMEAEGSAAQQVVDAVHAIHFDGVQAMPTGPAILLKEVDGGMRGAMARMGLIAVLVMIAVLGAVVRVRWRLLPLAVVAVGSVWAFGVMGYAGISLTMVTISALPVLIGLGVDFAIQTQSRYDEESRHAAHDDDTEMRAITVRRTLVPMGPALTVAMVAAVAGFLALRLSSVPMVRDYGLMLAVGVAVLYAAGLLLPPALLPAPARVGRAPTARHERRFSVERVVRFLTTVARGRVVAVLVVAVVVASVGLVLERRTTIQSDPEGFIPQDSPVLAQLRHVRDVAGSSQELGFLVESRDVLGPDVLRWMASFQARELARHPHDLLSGQSAASIAEQVTGAPPTTAEVETVLRSAPQAIRDTFVSPDRRQAHVIFALGPISLLQQKQLLASMRADIHPPHGVGVTPSGLAVIGIASVDALNTNRTWMTYLALAAALLWLLLFTRSFAWALMPLLPVLIGVGTSSIVLYYLGVSLSPLTAVSGPIIVATCTEFSVLVMARYVEERAHGRDSSHALDRASSRIGRSFVASGLTVVGGFGVLAVSNFPLLESFGIVVAVHILVALVASLVVLPPMLVWADARVGLDRVSRHFGGAPTPPGAPEPLGPVGPLGPAEPPLAEPDAGIPHPVSS
ncbi:MAG TPA: MMPL family transporter [Acidimicrobiia bacterium]